LGYVLAIKGRRCIVKFANDRDASIPPSSVDELLARPDPSLFAYGAELVDHVPSVKAGDLVMCVAAREAVALGNPGLAAIITAKVKPHYILSQGGWQLHPIEH
jgi:hypothetical protein